MPENKKFKVFGEDVEVLAGSNATNDSFCMILQTSPPGGGPPPHVHKNEDETFTVLEGEFELFDGKQWTKVHRGESVFGLRGGVNTFRNSGPSDGKILVMAVPGGLDRYLEAISPLVIPKDLARLTEISDTYGITFIPEQAVAA